MTWVKEKALKNKEFLLGWGIGSKVGVGMYIAGTAVINAAVAKYPTFFAVSSYVVSSSYMFVKKVVVAAAAVVTMS